MKNLITFSDSCINAKFIQRKKRFLVEVLYEKKYFWVHTNNTGSMLGLLKPEREVFLSHSSNPNRKYAYTLELIKLFDFWVGVNTLVPNRILFLGWQNNVIPELKGYKTFKREKRVGNSRLDAFLQGPDGDLWVEAKNVTLVEDGVAFFPDAITTRGQKHIQELIKISKSGKRVALFFLIQRPDSKCFAPADFIDYNYSKLLYDAIENGIEIWPYTVNISKSGIELGSRLRLKKFNI